MIIQILKKTPLLLCAGAMIVFSSCNSNEAESVDNNSTNETVNESPRALIDDNSSGNQATEGNVINENTQNAPVNMNSGNNASITLNPPHGEPGHDCAIKVGDPLPSSASSSAPVFNNAPSNNSVKLNPPHGEPGHDCAIKVGDPLR